jgi:hypothetical protein
VAPVHLHQLLHSEETQPQEEWHVWAVQVLADSSRRVNARLLHHIGWVDAVAQLPVHPKLNNAQQTITVPLQQDPQRMRVSRLDQLQ